MAQTGTISYDELIDNLVIRGLVTKPDLEIALRSVSRELFYPGIMTDGNRHDDTLETDILAINALNLTNGMRFLHYDCDTSFVNAVVGFLLGPWGRNCGVIRIQIPPNAGLLNFIQFINLNTDSPRLDQFLAQGMLHNSGYCVPKMFSARNLMINRTLYDCVYCNRDIPDDELARFIFLVRIGGKVVLNNQNMLKLYTREEAGWSVENLKEITADPLSEPFDLIVRLPLTAMPTLERLSALKVRVQLSKEVCDEAVSRGIKRPTLISYIKDNIDGLEALIQSLGIDMAPYTARPVRRSIISAILEAAVDAESVAGWSTYLGQVPRLDITDLNEEQELMEKKTYLLRGIYLYSEAVKGKPPSHQIDVVRPLFDESLTNLTKADLPKILHEVVRLDSCTLEL